MNKNRIYVLVLLLMSSILIVQAQTVNCTDSNTTEVHFAGGSDASYDSGDFTISNPWCFHITGNVPYAQAKIDYQADGSTNIYFAQTSEDDFILMGARSRLQGILPLTQFFDSPDVMLAIAPNSRTGARLKLSVADVAPIGGDGWTPAGSLSQLVQLGSSGYVTMPIPMACAGTFKVYASRLNRETDVSIHVVAASASIPGANSRDHRGLSWRDGTLTKTVQISANDAASSPMRFAYIRNQTNSQIEIVVGYDTIDENCSAVANPVLPNANDFPGAKQLLSSPPSGTITDIWTEHNVYFNDVKGMRIHVTLRHVCNLGGREIRTSAYFYFRDGDAIPDRNDQYDTTEGYVSTGKSVTPSGDSECVRYDDVDSFIPYHELELAPYRNSNGDTFRLRYYVRLYIRGENTELDQSAWQYFTYTYND